MALTASSTRSDETQVIEPTLNTRPPPPADALADDHLGAALVGVQALRQEPEGSGRLGRALVGLVPGRAARAALVQARRPEHVAVAKPGPGEHPVVRRAVGDPVRRARS